MEEIVIARDLSVGLIAALLGGIIATRLRLPAIIGYLIAGIMVGPYTPGITGDTGRIQLLAEIGVVLLMFGVGVNFSIAQLREVQRIAVIGGMAQVALSVLLGIGVGALLGWPWSWQVFFGCIVAISSTTVLLKLFMDRGELGSQHGQIAIGLSLVQDLSTVLMMALLPAVTSGQEAGATLPQIGWAFTRAGLFLGLMLLLGTRFFPWLLERVARYGSRELFLLTAVALSVGTALLAAAGFGLSLALGAFVAGLVVSESEVQYRILGEVIPIRDVFAVLFFVSVGMLIDPAFLWANLPVVLLVSATIVVGKFLITALVIWRFPYPRRSLLLAAAGLAQIGEFSFILAQQGLQIGAFDDYLYGLTLSGALLSILVVPLLTHGMGPLASWLNRVAPSRAARPRAARPEVPGGLRDHVVVCGYGRIGSHLAEALRALGHACVVIEQDWMRAQLARARGVHVIYGDATQPAVLSGAQLATARVVAVSIPDPAVQRLVVQQVHQHYPDLPIIARAQRVDDLPYLYGDGAIDVVVPAFEGGLEMLRRTLTRLSVTAEAIQNYTDAVRSERYAPWQQQETGSHVLHQLRSASDGLTLQWYQLDENSIYVGETILDLGVRKQTGASIVALMRGAKVIVNPEPSTRLQAGDRLAIVGNSAQLHRFLAWLAAGTQPLEQEVNEAGVHDD